MLSPGLQPGLASSQIALPGEDLDFTSRGLTAPASLWLCDEADGVLNDSIGSAPLSPVGTPKYRQPVPGSIHRGVSVADASGDRMNMAAGVGPNPAVTSVLMAGILWLPSAPSGTHKLFGLPTSIYARVNTAPVLQGVAGVSSAAGSSSPVGRILPIVVQSNLTASSFLVASDVDKLAPPFAAPVDGNKGLGGTGGSDTCGAVLLRAWMYTGAAAEMTNAEVKSMLQAFGFTVAWT